MNGGNQHATALKAHHLAGRQVHNRYKRLSDKHFGLVILRDAGEDLPIHACAVIQSEAKQLV